MYKVIANCNSYFYEDNKHKVGMPYKLYHGYIWRQMDNVDYEGFTFVW